MIVFTGLILLWRYKATPGTVADAPARWPAASQVHRTAGRPTLVVFAHPQCPCTRATLDELATVMARVGGAVDAVVLFTRPDGTSDAWVHGELWAKALRIPGVTPIIDERGAEAARFGSNVSGQTMLYDAAGELRFSGGITGARGHVGDNAGRMRLVSLIETGHADSALSHVFGCALRDAVAEVR